MDAQEDTMEAGRGPLVSRRAVAIGAVWTVPVIITAVAAPAASASTGPNLASSSSMVKNPSQNYTLTLYFSLPAGGSEVVTIISVVGTTGKTPATFGPVPQSQTVTYASPDAVFSLDRDGSNPANSVVVTYSLDGGKTQQQLTIKITGT